MAKKGGSSNAKGAKLSVREIIMLVVIAVLIVALLVTLFAGDKLGGILGAINGSDNSGNVSDGDGQTTPTITDRYIYNSVLGGAQLNLPAELDGATLEVHFINVGQGDAIVCMLPDGKIMLIDAGNRNKADTQVDKTIRTSYENYLKDNLHVDMIDYMIITHPDADHVNIIKASVLDAYEVAEIFYNAASDKYDTTKTYERFLAAAGTETTAAGKAVLHEVGESTETYTIDGGSYKFELYAPGNGGFANAASAKNSASIMAVLSYGGRKVMFTGDAEVETEEWFMETVEGECDVDVLKVGHHGSYSCTSTQFLDFIKPEYAVISCDDGKEYHHPHPETMNKLFNYGVVTYRTNRHGNIVLYIDEDGDFGFLPEHEVAVENNTKERNPFMMLKETLNNAA